MGQAYLLSTDLDLYDETLDCPCSVRSSNLVQELGLVSNIFSDKTGTLTRNEMKFVKFILDGQSYDVEQTVLTNRGSTFRNVVSLSLESQGQHSPFYKFFECLVLCHTVIREKDGKYRAESPDELALVEGADIFGFSIFERGTSNIEVNLLNQRKRFSILAVNAFNSDRKRMSVLVHDPDTNEYKLLLKGADSTVLDLCPMSQDTRRTTDTDLLHFACLGLRTLCIAGKKVSEKDALNWLASWKAAANSLTQRARLLEEAAAAIEVGMELLGITAIEDKLQDEVPQVISDLAAAGIVLWMLTGDKEETAINIGHSCNLLREDTTTFMLTKIKTEAEFKSALQTTYTSVLAGQPHAIAPGSVPGQAQSTTNEAPSPSPALAFVVDGPSLTFFDETDINQRLWILEIGKRCRCVIGCRLTPIQKQQLVRIVKEDSKPKAVTLSIGDGANDVSMIREADVGVGIYGKEGRQAANSADFAIGQFRFLRKMLLVHGRWNYVRQSKVFLYSMHKNMVLTLTLFWFR